MGSRRHGPLPRGMFKPTAGPTGPWPTPSGGTVGIAAALLITSEMIEEACERSRDEARKRRRELGL